jgi:hypothetical protein
LGIPNFSRLGAFVAGGLLLAQCTGPSRQGVLPLTPAATAGRPADSAGSRQSSRPVSWMAKGIGQRDLLYVSNANGTVNVYTYWQHNLVGVLTNFTQPMGECADGAGNVYITDYQGGKIDEYAHGSKRAIRIIKETGYTPDDCAVSGDLAITNFDNGSYTPGTVAIYAHGSGKPKLYQASSSDEFIYCAYDARGDLLATSRYYYYYHFFFYYNFFYLPKNGTSLLPMTIPGPSPSGTWDEIDDVGWDGKYWVIASGGVLYRFTIGVKAKLVDKIQISGGTGNFGLTAFYRKSPTSIANQVVETGSSYSRTNGSVSYWKYPTGGYSVGRITKDLDDPFGAAISLAPQ